MSVEQLAHIDSEERLLLMGINPQEEEKEAKDKRLKLESRAKEAMRVVLSRENITKERGCRNNAAAEKLNIPVLRKFFSNKLAIELSENDKQADLISSITSGVTLAGNSIVVESGSSYFASNE